MTMPSVAAGQTQAAVAYRAGLTAAAGDDELRGRGEESRGNCYAPLLQLHRMLT